MSEPGTTAGEALRPDLGDPETYRAHLGTTFRADHDAGRVDLRLVEVERERVGGGFAQFSIFFHGPADHVLPQAVHTMHHEALGAFALFIVPVVGSNHEGILYQACFSRPAAHEPCAPSREP
jgi:hypothetical protein